MLCFIDKAWDRSQKCKSTFGSDALGADPPGQQHKHQADPGPDDWEPGPEEKSTIHVVVPFAMFAHSPSSRRIKPVQQCPGTSGLAAPLLA
jgi:hypothetical protein